MHGSYNNLPNHDQSVCLPWVADEADAANQGAQWVPPQKRTIYLPAHKHVHGMRLCLRPGAMHNRTACHDGMHEGVTAVV